ncbi:MAG: hypothetical protein AAF802_29870 [Planctomycetota bacterium]
MNPLTTPIRAVSLLQYLAGFALLAYTAYAFVMTQRMTSAVNQMIEPGSGPPFVFPAFGWFIFGAMIVFSLLAVVTGYFLQFRRGYWYCVIIAGAECLYVPVGTVLGFLTLLVLLRPSVAAEFGTRQAMQNIEHGEPSDARRVAES